MLYEINKIYILKFKIKWDVVHLRNLQFKIYKNLFLNRIIYNLIIVQILLNHMKNIRNNHKNKKHVQNQI